MGKIPAINHPYVLLSISREKTRTRLRIFIKKICPFMIFLFLTLRRIVDQRERRSHLRRYRVSEILGRVIAPIGLMEDF